MPTALGYPGLRCVLEFLDPMKRIHIAARNHSLWTIDKTIPIWIEELEIYREFLKLDKYSTEISFDIRFSNRQNAKFHQVLPEQLNQGEAITKLLNSYLGGRSKIYVNFLSIYGMYSPVLPPNFIIRINELGCCFSYINRFLANIDPCSFPLKKLRTGIDEPDHLNHPILTSAEEVIFTCGANGIQKLIDQNNGNKRVTFEDYRYNSANPVVLIRHWMKNGIEIGATLKLHNNNDNDRLLHILLQELKEFENKRFNSSLNCPRLIIPINRTAEIHVIVSSKNSIVVEVVPKSLKRRGEATEEPSSSKKAKQ
ncbi:hypothetical protein GCK72_008031 [Caenorhabditis remanei]|uniref:F-box associated domain-containing protein n=1 Tax=Caenorhabditis remanei TaxID=31234 RepID=A0A6A5HIS8_CAERE|nr:hypothetical protein GCK72_008031 [Caenorhabditis remanei]KAF1768070.1 hypothetical protein GCK72_008031 [Caenorhabditis remanei]